MVAFETHYTVQEIAEKWHLSETVIRSLFRDEPGVLKIDSPERRFKHGYCSMRLPESVVQRVHARLGKRSYRFMVALLSCCDFRYPAMSFDVVFSSFMFHHLQGSSREKTLREVLRVLKPEGSFYLLDFEASPSGHGLFKLFHSGERLRDNSESRILTLMGDAGFPDRKKVAVHPVLFDFGRAGYYQASALR